MTDILTLRTLSKEFKYFIDNSDLIWKEKTIVHFIHSYNAFSSQTGTVWRNIFIEAWKDEMSNGWVEITKKTNTFENKNRSVIHGPNTYYLPVRTKRGTKNDRFRSSFFRLPTRNSLLGMHRC